MTEHRFTTISMCYLKLTDLCNQRVALLNELWRKNNNSEFCDDQTVITQNATCLQNKTMNRYNLYLSKIKLKPKKKFSWTY